MPEKIPQPFLATIVPPESPALEKEKEKEILVNLREVKLHQRAQLEMLVQRVTDLEKALEEMRSRKGPSDWQEIARIKRAMAAFSLIITELPLSDKQKATLRDDTKNKALRAAVKAGNEIRITFPTNEGRFSVVFEPIGGNDLE